MTVEPNAARPKPSPSEPSLEYSIALDVLRTLRPTGKLDADLRGLQKVLGEMREKYRNNRVSRTYSLGERLAYLLAYFPPYMWSASRVLGFADLKTLADRQSAQAAFLCAGPGTEAAALVQQLGSLTTEKVNLSISLFDFNAADWEPIQHAVLNETARRQPSVKFDLHSRFLDLTEPETIHAQRETFERCHLVMAQNCLNEVHDDQHSIEALLAVWGYLPSGAQLILADLDYTAWKNVSTALRHELVPSHIAGAEAFNEMHTLRFESTIPDALKRSFFAERGDFWDKRAMKFGYLILTKA